MQSEIEALTVRVARLERANRKLRMMAVATALASAALLSTGFSRPPTLQAEKFVIRDSHGRARLTIGTPGVSGTAIDMKRDEPAIWLTDESGSDRAILSSDGLYLASGAARPLVSVTSGPVRPELRLYGPDGKVTWSAP